MDIIHNVPSYVKVEPYGKTTEFNATFNGVTKSVSAVAGDVLDFYFPKGYIDLNSLSMMFKYMNIGTGTGTAQGLPKDTECMIDRLEVYLGDKKVNDIINYNQIFYILSWYASSAEFVAQRQSIRNIYTNGRPVVATSLDNYRFCCEKWLGLLGQNVVLDTHTLGQLRVCVTLANSYVTSSTSPLNSYGVRDVYMKVKYYENYKGDLPKYIEFDEFKSIKTRMASYNQKTELIVSNNRIDYVLARTLFESHLTKASALSADLVTTNAFVGRGENIAYWNILVNNNPIFKFRPDAQDAFNVMSDIFHDKTKNMSQVVSTDAGLFNRSWTCGAELGFVNEKKEQVEISFVTESVIPVVTSGINFPLVIVKCTSSLQIHPDGYIQHII
jgi:hypothetical protein